jgi:hypothetical protein
VHRPEQPVGAVAQLERAQRVARRVVGDPGLDEKPHERQRLGPVPGVDVHLTAAGLRRREVDVDAEALEQLHSRLRRFGEHGVVEAGHEQSDLHVSIPSVVAWWELSVGPG